MSINSSNGHNILMVRNTPLRQSQFDGKPVVRARESDSAAADDPILVSRTKDGWAPVQKLDGSVGREELGANYALWKDEPEYDCGFWRGCTKVNDGDGQVQPKEIRTFKPVFERGLWPLKKGAEDSRKRTFPSTTGYAGGEIVTSDQGAEIREVAYVAVADYTSHNTFIGHSIWSSDSHWLINE